ncbi:asparagine synthetase B family protein [Rugamonas sp. DEMB1]|uniref:asparagine synthetase B family protein n=1 Tax=Rugamonas sp. DEMB1 TaxID=3039386 RepID=UPI002448BDD7|nr:asparagine synthase-related protein [Rugamonas sp. DEMB1]WGG48196.1 asparagine synthase-related protein [Rugamonas sp. DEMB1]
MSGICGWIGHGGQEDGQRGLLHAMAVPMQRFDDAALHCHVGKLSAVAVAATPGAALLLRVGQVQLAIWGRPRLRDATLAQQAQGEGLGRVLAGLWRQGPELLCQQLAGSFALCLIDEAAGEALLALDRMGTLPLSWQLSGETLVFASTADALRRHPAAPARIDPQSIYNYVYFHMVPSPGSVYHGQQRMAAGHYLHYRQGGVEQRCYWRIAFEEQGGAPFGELREQFRQVLRSSVKEAAEGARSGAFLSGGTDSSTIAGVLGEVSGAPARTYSIGFDAPEYDESAYARIAADHFHTEHHAYYVTPQDVVDAIPKIGAVFDQPFGNASAVPAYYCARLAKADGIERLLGGDGGDELFGGNERYAKQSVFARYERLPRLLRRALEPAVNHFPGRDRLYLTRKAHSYIAQASVAMPARLETYNLLGRYGPSQVFSDDFLAQTDAGAPLASLSATYGRSEARSLINRMMALDLKITLADNDLPKVVKACELAGMQVAFPFLDDAMVAFSTRLTPAQKLNGTQLRYFFKEALRGFLPEAILSKQKHGFGLPFGVWLQDHAGLRELAGASLHSLAKRGVVRPAFIEQLLSQHLREHAGYHGTMVWVLMMLEQWYQQHEDRHG